MSDTKPSVLTLVLGGVALVATTVAVMLWLTRTATVPVTTTAADRAAAADGLAVERGSAAEAIVIRTPVESRRRSSRPPNSRRSITAWATTAAVVPIPVPATTPPTPNGAYSASAASA